MNNQKRIEKLKEKDYQKYFGVNKATFDKMLEILEEEEKNISERKDIYEKIKRVQCLKPNNSPHNLNIFGKNVFSCLKIFICHKTA